MERAASMPVPTSSDEAYRQAGVDLGRADAAVGIAKRLAARTDRPDLKTDIGGFAGAFEIPPGYRRPVLLSACDGVGTKLKLAFEANRHDTVGIDLVAMNVNDILATGGEPLVFLDYLATGNLDTGQFEAVLSGVAEGCRQADCVLSGGETAEMPGFYPGGEYDLAGFAIGVAEKDRLYPQKDRMKPGDVLIGLASSGFHSNGYSLVRKIMADHGLDLNRTYDDVGQSLIDALLTPTRIYVKPVLAFLNAHGQSLKGMVHVTGGGFYGNIPRILPEHLSARLDSLSWTDFVPPVMGFIQKTAGLDNPTLWHTFNGGVGFVLIVDAASADDTVAYFGENGERAAIIGELTPGNREVVIS